MNALDLRTQKVFLFMLSFPLLAYAGIVLLNLRDPLYFFRIFLLFYGGYHLLITKKKYHIPKFSWALLMFVLYEYVWSFFNGGNQGRFLNLSYIYENENFVVFVATVIIYNTMFGHKFINRSVIVMKTLVILSALVTFIQIFEPNFLSAIPYFTGAMQDNNIYSVKRSSFFGFIDPNSVGLDFVPILAVLIGYLKINNDKYLNIYLILGGLVCFGTNARYVMINYLVIVLVFVFSSIDKSKNILRVTRTLIFIIVFFVSIGLLLSFNFNTWVDSRLFQEGSIEETERFRAYYTFSVFFPNSPLIGSGIFSSAIEDQSIYDQSSNIHMGYLRTLVIYGIIGGLFLFGAWILMVKKFYTTFRSSKFFGAFVGIVTFMFAYATFYESSLFFFGMIFCFIFDKYFSDGVKLKRLLYV